MKPFQNFGREHDLVSQHNGSGNGNGNGHVLERRPGDIEEEIERTRARMASTLEAIKKDLSPGQMVDQVLHSVREGKAHDVALSTFHAVGEIVKANPLPSAVIGAGLVWLAASNKSRSPRPSAVTAESTPSLQRELKLEPQDVESASASGAGEGRVAHAKERVADVAHGATARVKGAAHDVASKARDVARSAGTTATSSVARARDATARTYGEQPLVIGAIAIGLGALIGALLPPTTREDELIGAQRDRVKQRVDDAGAQLLGRVREKVDESAQRLQAKMQSSSVTQPPATTAQSTARSASTEPLTAAVPQTDEGDFGGP